MVWKTQGDANFGFCPPSTFDHQQNPADLGFRQPNILDHQQIPASLGFRQPNILDHQQSPAKLGFRQPNILDHQQSPAELGFRQPNILNHQQSPSELGFLQPNTFDWPQISADLGFRPPNTLNGPDDQPKKLPSPFSSSMCWLSDQILPAMQINHCMDWKVFESLHLSSQVRHPSLLHPPDPPHLSPFGFIHLLQSNQSSLFPLMAMTMVALLQGDLNDPANHFQGVCNFLRPLSSSPHPPDSPLAVLDSIAPNDLFEFAAAKHDAHMSDLSADARVANLPVLFIVPTLDNIRDAAATAAANASK
ncbi:hypothetical protein PtB15_2B643 [Puccinia triticina]|nr:hypothetical protein PtB15_2B643 [Puccinia triticina]